MVDIHIQAGTVMGGITLLTAVTAAFHERRMFQSAVPEQDVRTVAQWRPNNKSLHYFNAQTTGDSIVKLFWSSDHDSTPLVKLRRVGQYRLNTT